jgi:hypothetical protein
MSFDPEIGEPQGWSEPQAESQHEAQYEAPQYRSWQEALTPEAQAMLGEWFQEQIGGSDVIRSLQEAQTMADIGQSVNSFESRFDLTQREMNEVLETAISFGADAVNSTPVDQLLDYAYRAWASGGQPTAEPEQSTQAAAPAELSQDRFARVNDAFARADATFESMLGPESERHQRQAETLDRTEKRLRRGLSSFDLADDRLAARYRAQR